MQRFYYSLMRSVKYGADRMIGICDMLTRRAYGIRQPRLRRFVQHVAQIVGGYAYLALLLPKLDVFRLTGRQWSAVYIGDIAALREVEALLFPNGVISAHEMRIPTWNLPRMVRHYCQQVDLVVCSVGRYFPNIWRPDATYRFTSPLVVNMVMDITMPLADMLAQQGWKKIRYVARKVRQLDLSIRISTDRADFALFHYDLYRPHIEKRHGDRALISGIEDQWRHWMADGGELLILEHSGRPVAATPLKYYRDICFNGEEGIAVDIDPEIGRYLQMALWIYGIERAQERGARRLFAGRNNARLSDPVFQSKRRWQAVVVDAERSNNPELIYLADQLPDTLIDHLNEQGLITLAGEQALLVQIARPGRTIATTDVDQAVAGILQVSANRRVVHKQTATSELASGG